MMKKIIFSLFSTIFFFGCVTVRKIDKKDSKNNQFSQELQNWFYIKHPQRIDTTTRVKSDTSYYYSDGDSDVLNEKLPNSVYLGKDSIGNSVIFMGPFPFDNGIIDGSLTIDSVGSSWHSNGSIWSSYSNKDTLIERIRDTVFITTINQSEINALKNSLIASRDSTTTYVLSLANEKNKSLKYLIAIIALSITTFIGGYFSVKSLI